MLNDAIDVRLDINNFEVWQMLIGFDSTTLLSYTLERLKADVSNLLPSEVKLMGFQWKAMNLMII